MPFLSLDGLCPTRGDSALIVTTATPTNTDQPDNTTGLFELFDSIPGSNPGVRPLRNNINTFPFCLAFTVGNLEDTARDTLMYAAPNQPLLVAGETIELMIGTQRVTFNRNVSDSITRAQICLNGTYAVLYIDCTEVQRLPFNPPAAGLQSIGVIAEPFSLANPYSVS